MVVVDGVLMVEDCKCHVFATSVQMFFLRDISTLLSEFSSLPSDDF